MEAAGFAESFVNIYQIMRRHIKIIFIILIVLQNQIRVLYKVKKPIWRKISATRSLFLEKQLLSIALRHRKAVESIQKEG